MNSARPWIPAGGGMFSTVSRQRALAYWGLPLLAASALAWLAVVAPGGWLSEPASASVLLLALVPGALTFALSRLGPRLVRPAAGLDPERMAFMKTLLASLPNDIGAVFGVMLWSGGWAPVAGVLLALALTGKLLAFPSEERWRRLCEEARAGTGALTATGGPSVPSAFGEGTSRSFVPGDAMKLRPPVSPLAPAQPHPAAPSLVTRPAPPTSPHGRRVIAATPGKRVGAVILVVLGLALAAAPLLLGARSAATSLAPAFLGYFWVLGAVALGRLLWKVFEQRAVVTDEGIELVGPGRRRASLRRDELTGCAWKPFGRLVLLGRTRDAVSAAGRHSLPSRPPDPCEVEIEIGDHLDPRAVRDWLGPAVPETPVSRPPPRTRARHVERVASAALWLAWSLFGGVGAPVPVVLVAAALPVAVFAAHLVRPQALRLATDLHDDAPALWFPLLAPGPVVAAWALDRFHPVHEAPLWLAALAGGGLLLVLLRAREPALGRATGLVAFPCLAAWALGVVLLVNGLPEPPPGTPHHPRVLAVPERGAKAPLVLEAFGPFRAPVRVGAPKAVLRAVAAGEPFRVDLVRGALGLSWIEVIAPRPAVR